MQKCLRFAKRCLNLEQMFEIKNRTEGTEIMSIGNYRLQSPGRLARAAVIFAVGIGFSISSISGSVAGDSGPVDLDYITVQQGESLWELASQHAPKADPRDWIAEVVMLNALNSIDLTPGQQIALP